MTDKEKIREEVERLQIELIQEKENGFGSDTDDACILELQNVLTYIDSLQEEPVSEDLEEAADEYAPDFSNSITPWKDAQGDDLPEIDREVVVLLNNGRVAFGHRPPEYWDGKDIITGKVTRNYVERYDKGLWNIPNVKYWLDVELPK